MNRASRIENLLKQSLNPVHLEIEDESHMHSGPKSETHFKVLIVSEVFEGLSRVDRQRKVNEVLALELQSGLHALSQRALSPQEWQKQGATAGFVSPNCMGGSKK